MAHAAEASGIMLRPLTDQDAHWICAYASSYNVAKMVSRIPHPYNLEMAYQFIDVQAANQKSGDSHVFAIISGKPVGVVGLEDAKDGSAELGFWLGEPYWNKGYASQAVAEMLGYAFGKVDLARVWAGHFIDNPASGRVLEKNGFRYLPDDRLRKCLARGEKILCRQMEIRRDEWLQNQTD